MSRIFTFALSIDAEMVRNIMYSSPVKRLSVMTREGLRLELPIAHFQKFVTHEGIRGEFRLELEGSSFVSLERIR